MSLEQGVSMPDIIISQTLHDFSPHPPLPLTPPATTHPPFSVSVPESSAILRGP